MEKACAAVELCSGDPCSRVGPGRAEQGPVSTAFAAGGAEMQSRGCKHHPPVPSPLRTCLLRGCGCR